MRRICATHSRSSTARATVLAAAALLLAVAARPAQAFSISYLYTLSGFTGTLPMSSAALAFDANGKETYALAGGVVRIFNESGMETYNFGADLIQVQPRAVVAVEDGDIIALVITEDSYSLIRCDYRGEPLGRVEIKGVPSHLQRAFQPTVVRFANGQIYLADLVAKRVLVVTTAGEFVTSHDLGRMLEFAEEERTENDIAGFNVAPNGNLLFTVPTKFKAYVAKTDGKVEGFGVKGGAPGKFNVVHGIAGDERGNVYVTDVVKSAVIVFDSQYRFLREFGYRGGKPANLVGPVEVVYGNGKLYVSQRAARGVNVYAVSQE